MTNTSEVNISLGDGKLEAKKIAGRDIVEGAPPSPSFPAVEQMGDITKNSQQILADMHKSFMEHMAEQSRHHQNELSKQGERLRSSCRNEIQAIVNDHRVAIDRLLIEKGEAQKRSLARISALERQVSDSYRATMETQQILDEKNKEIVKLVKQNSKQSIQIQKLENRVNALEYKKK